MARRWLLGEAAQARLVGLPADEREVIRYATLGPEDWRSSPSAAGKPTNSALR